MTNSIVSGYGAQQSIANNNMANNAYQQNQSSFHQQQALMRQYNQAMAKKPKAYRFNGKDMDAEEFADTLFPDDCPEKTYLLLKMKGNENE